MATAGTAARHHCAAAGLGGGDPGVRELVQLHRRLVQSADDRAHSRRGHRRLGNDGPLAAMTMSTATAPADGAATSDALPSAPPGAGTGPTAGPGSAREGKQWLAAQGRPGRRFLLAASLADLAATAG